MARDKKHPRNISSSRKKKRKNAPEFKPESRTVLASLDKGSLYDQEGCEKQRQIAIGIQSTPNTTQGGTSTSITPDFVTTAGCSSLRVDTPDTTTDVSPAPEVLLQTNSRAKMKLKWANERGIGPNDESERDSSSEGTDDDTTDARFEKPIHNWIMDISALSDYISELACCKTCQGDLILLEEKSSRAGLGTRLQLQCVDENCQSRHDRPSLDTTNKSGHVYDINLRNVLAMRAIGKGRTASEKYNSIIGLAPPITSTPWGNKTQALLKK